MTIVFDDIMTSIAIELHYAAHDCPDKEISAWLLVFAKAILATVGHLAD